MIINWRDHEDYDNPEYQCSGAIIAGGYLTASVSHTTREDEDDVPWNACVNGKIKGDALIGYESMAAAKEAAEKRIVEIVRELSDFVAGK